MKRLFSKYFFFLIILIFLFTTGYMTLYYREGSSAVLWKAFKASSAEFMSGEVFVWGNAEVKDAGFDNMIELADDFAVDMGVVKNDVFSRNIIKNDFIDKIEIIGSDSCNRTVNIVAQLNREGGGLSERYVSVGISGDFADMKIEDTALYVKDMFKRYKVKPKSNSCITGCFEGKLGYEKLNEISRKILKVAGAKKVNGISDNNLISVSAYSPLIGNTLKIDGKKVNMNLAIRYNSYENKTYIWLASPVITIEY